jgi:DNA polymerase III subunit epsilon
MPDFWSFFKKRKQRKAPSWWYAHVEACENSWDPAMPVQDAPVVVLDTETTGLKVRRDSIRSIGAIHIRYPELLTDTFFERQFPVASDMDSGVIVHQILPHRGQLDIVNGLKATLDFIGTRIIVGHHIAFDGEMLERALSRHFQCRVKLPNPLVDTASLAQRLFPRHPMQRPWSLDELCQHLSIPVYERHTAGGDAFATGLVYLKLLGRLSEIRSLRLEDVLSPPRKPWRL